MSLQLNPDDLSRFDDFRIFRATYKTVSSHALTTDILIPSHLLLPSPPTPAPTASAARPILLRFHGGGLIAGSSLSPDLFAPWHLQLAQRHGAVIVSPNYRLLPESTVADILADVEDHWAWLHASLPSFVASECGANGVAVDTSRIMCAGDSAGGYLSLMHGLSHPRGIRAVTAAYPLVDAKSAHFTQAYDKVMVGLDPALFPRSVVDEHREKVRKGELPPVASEDARLERGALMFAMTRDGFCGEFFPEERDELFVLDRLVTRAERFPRGGVFVWHGRADSVVPVEGSLKLERVVREVDPGLRFRLTLTDGDHGFDAESSIDEDWMAEGLREIVDAWLA